MTPQKPVARDEVIRVDQPPMANPDPDHAWKALGLVNDWIRHVDAKVGATLAADGVVGVILFNLVKELAHPSLAISTAAVVCALAVFVTGFCAALALLPRLRASWWKKEEPTNLLFFDHIVRAHGHDAPSYVDVLCTLSGNSADLTRHIANQVHSNATVAHRKYEWTNHALVALLVALFALGVTSALIAVGTMS